MTARVWALIDGTIVGIVPVDMTAATEQKVEGFTLPRRFGGYVLFDRIGQGGMAEIYLARGRTQMGVERLAVVKVVLPRFAQDARFEAMLVTEAKLAARLSHANVVQTFDLGREEGQLFIAMQYVEGFDLKRLLKELARKQMGLPAEYGFFIVMEALRALDYAHRRRDDQGKPLGLVHRDVSPSNILVSLEGEVKLCDFGIARAVLDVGDLPIDALEGKAAYMAPEHARGEMVDGRADVFAASIILWEMMSGRRMYKAHDGKDVYEVAREGIVPPLPDRGLPDYPRLSGIVGKGLATDREQRYATAGAMLRDLEDYAVAAKLMASPMKFAAFLQEHFEADMVETRRARERAAEAVPGADGEAGDVPRLEVLPMLGGVFHGESSAVRPRAPGARPSTDDLAAVETLDADDLIAVPTAELSLPSVPTPTEAVPTVVPEAVPEAVPEVVPEAASITPTLSLAQAPSKKIPVWVPLVGVIVLVLALLAVLARH